MKPYEIIVNQILDKLEEGILPWHKSWIGGIPCNYETNIEYRGINKLILLFDDYKDKRYLTAKQIIKLGGNIKKGEKATKVIFWKYQEQQENETENNKYSYPIIKYYNIFNIQQTDGIEVKHKREVDLLNRYSKAQEIMELYKDKPQIIQGVNPCYKPLIDTIEMPNLHSFKSIDEYYSTLYHELIHSTGHKTRLNRFGDKVLNYGNNEYSFEELVAEIGAMFLCQEVGIIQKTKDNSISYIKGWLEYLSKNKKDIIYASSLAEKCTRYIQCKE